MGTKNYAGFTIVETMLFLAVSAFLIFAMIAGTGASLNIQRYRDSVETFKSVLQQQYADLSSVVNSPDDTWGCSATASPAQGGATQNRGQSDCMIVGKYVHIDGSDMSIYNVIGYEANNTIQTNDIDTLRNNYILNAAKSEATERTMEWGTYIDGKMGILVVRSPDSGQIYTFTNVDGDVPDTSSINASTFTTMLIPGDTVPGQGAQQICISTRGLFVNQDRAVYLNAFASNASAVEIRSNEMILAAGGTQC